MFSFNFFKSKSSPPALESPASQEAEAAAEQFDPLGSEHAHDLLKGLNPGIRRELFQLVESMVPRHVVRDLGLQSGTVREAVSVLTEASPALGMYLDRFGYRTVGQGLRDINEAARLAILRRAEWAVQANPIAQRAMGIRTDLIVSEGFDIKATSQDPKSAAEVQRVLDTHWKLNDWEERIRDRVLDLGVTGEMIRLKPTLEAQLMTGETFNQGFFRAGMILPHNVKALIANPWDAERLIKMRLNLPDVDGKGWVLREYDIVQQELYGRYAGTITGDVLFMGVNRRPGATRGVSDLLATMEWLDIHDQLLFSEAERTRNLLKHIWDVTIVGADSRKVQDRAAEIKRTPPNNGTVFVHNEKEIWKTVVPGLTSAQSLGLIDVIFKQIWGGCGLPEHYFVSADSVNKASSQEMAEPVWAWARTRKAQVMHFLRLEHELAIQVASVNRELKVPRSEMTIEVISRDPDRTAYDAVGSSLQATAQSLGMAIQSQLIDLKNAQAIFRHVVEASGFKMTKLSEEELAKQDFSQTVQQGMDAVHAQKAALAKEKMSAPIKSVAA